MNYGRRDRERHDTFNAGRYSKVFKRLEERGGKSFLRAPKRRVVPTLKMQSRPVQSSVATSLYSELVCGRERNAYT